MDYNDYNNSPQYYNEQSLASQTSSVLKTVYLKMCLALVVSALVALYCSTSWAYLQFISTHSWAIWGLFIVELVLVFALSGAINKLSSGTAALLFYVFAAVNGAALAPIFLVYTHASIVKTFFICAGTFGAMSVYGYFTTQDLTKFGTYLLYALFGLIIASVVNIFTKSSTMEWIISGVGVLIFLGLTAYDTQYIRNMIQTTPQSMHSKLSTYGALNLYLDFINLFLYLLRFFGRSND
ncbi:MAG: Bax inhibitor-1/YccA family protein [Duncaniella sp.]|nr:Bax inhibitor-1/YccA family protein [Duncaniella sp.]